MPSFLQVDNLSKSYGPKVLFENISFNINEGDKIALVAPNGTGKTSLLRILAGKDRSDSGGSIKFLKDIRVAYLEQDYSFDPSETVASRVFDSDFDKEIRLRRILSELGVDPARKFSELSGGGVKRVAVAELLASGAEFLIMDEPTNHLDVDGIEYLENYLKKSRCTLFMVTHDRYFLDRVCNTVMEMDRGSIYVYRGDYENFLEKRDERISNYNARTDRARNLLRRELEWMHATPCARSGKAKYRKQAFWDLKERAENAYVSRQVNMDEMSSGTRLGTKVIDCKDLCFSYDDKVLINHFTYNFQRYERVGIVGENGIGKSTFLNLLVESQLPSIERGESLKIGYYRQGGMEFDENDTVLEVVPNTHLLGQFLFPHDMFSNRISKLSGGERRRLYLLTVLMQNPNLLILDEPTNDLDIVTLNALEEYLLDFKGSLIVVTHDRHFLDRIVDHLLVFCGDGQIKDFLGGYTEYRSFMEDLRARKKADARAAAPAAPGGSSAASRGAAAAGGSAAAPFAAPAAPGGSSAAPRGAAAAPFAAPAAGPSAKRRMSYKEKREFESLDATIASLSEEKAALEALLSGGSAAYEELTRASVRYQALKAELDAAELRWLELSELQ